MRTVHGFEFVTFCLKTEEGEQGLDAVVVAGRDRECLFREHSSALY